MIDLKNEIRIHSFETLGAVDAVKEPLPVITGNLNEPSADKTTVPASRFKNGGVTVLK